MKPWTSLSDIEKTNRILIINTSMFGVAVVLLFLALILR
jgi:hypothetical protein